MKNIFSMKNKWRGVMDIKDKLKHLTTDKILKGEEREISMSVHRISGLPIEFSDSPPLFQVRKHPYKPDDTIILPMTGEWETCGIYNNRVFAYIDTSYSRFIPGNKYRVYFKVNVINPNAVLKGYVQFKLVD